MKYFQIFFPDRKNKDRYTLLNTIFSKECLYLYYFNNGPLVDNEIKIIIFENNEKPIVDNEI